MGNSLRDQFLKVGLVTEKQVKQAKKQDYSAQVKGGKGKPAADNQDKQAAAQKAAQKAERDRQLNKQRIEAEERKAIAAQIRQLIEANRQQKGGDDVAYNFTHNNLIKRVYVSAEVHKRITEGQLVIVAMGSKYELVLPDVAEKIRERNPAAVVVHNRPENAQGEADDPYSAYKIPDDLIW